MSRKDCNMGCYAVNRPQNRGEFMNKLVFCGIWENGDFWCEDTSMSYLSIGSIITQF